MRTLLTSLFLSLFLVMAMLLRLEHGGTVKAAPSSHGIHFSWANPAGVTLSANTLYCGTATGTYTINWVLPVSTAFDWTTTDTQHTGVAGTKYFCVVTDTSGGIESSYSNEVSATFPTVPQAPAMNAPTTF